MPNNWFNYEDKVAETLSEFVSMILDTLKTPYLFRGQADQTGSWSQRSTVPTFPA